MYAINSVLCRLKHIKIDYNLFMLSGPLSRHSVYSPKFGESSRVECNSQISFVMETSKVLATRRLLLTRETYHNYWTEINDRSKRHAQSHINKRPKARGQIWRSQGHHTPSDLIGRERKDTQFKFAAPVGHAKRSMRYHFDVKRSNSRTSSLSI